MDALNGVVGLVELAEDVEQVGSNAFVAYQFALVFLTLGIVVLDLQIAQVGATDGAVLGEGAALHAGKDGIAQCVGTETIVLGLAA